MVWYGVLMQKDETMKHPRLLRKDLLLATTFARLAFPSQGRLALSNVLQNVSHFFHYQELMSHVGLTYILHMVFFPCAGTPLFVPSHRCLVVPYHTTTIPTTHSLP